MTGQKKINEFGIPDDIEYLRSKTKESFKNMVKKKARKVALNQLLNMKIKHYKKLLPSGWNNADKMRNIFSTEH